MRKSFLRVSLNSNFQEGTEAALNEIIKSDVKFLNRRITRLQNELEDAKERVEKRLASKTELDESVIDALFSAVDSVAERLERTVRFKQEYYGSEEEVEVKGLN